MSTDTATAEAAVHDIMLADGSKFGTIQLDVELENISSDIRPELYEALAEDMRLNRDESIAEFLEAMIDLMKSSSADADISFEAIRCSSSAIYQGIRATVAITITCNPSYHSTLLGPCTAAMLELMKVVKDGIALAALPDGPAKTLAALIITLL